MANNKTYINRYENDYKTHTGPIGSGLMRSLSGVPNKYVMELRKFIKTPLCLHVQNNLLVNSIISTLTDNQNITEKQLMFLKEHGYITVEGNNYKLII